MSIDYALILSAGFGTRMGEIGKDLPKPLWPLFETNLLTSQINFVKKFSPKKIFINTHHQHKSIADYISKNHPDIEIIFEEKILGSGGAIHNIKKILKSGKLLTTNSDNLIFFDDNSLNNLVESKSDISIMAMKVPEGSSFGRIKISKNNLFEGTTKSEVNPYTYSGLSVIQLEKLNLHEDVSSFFDTVVTPESKTQVIIPKNQEVWDFGTLANYIKSIESILTDDEILNSKIMRELSPILFKKQSFVEYKNKFLDDKIVTQGQLIMKWNNLFSISSVEWRGITHLLLKDQ